MSPLPSTPAPGRAARGHLRRAGGCCGHGAPQHCPVTLPRHVTVTRTMPKEPGEKSWHKNGEGGREQGWCRARSSAGRALPAAFHACLLLVFPPAREDAATKFAFSSFTDAQRGSAPPIPTGLRCTPMPSLGDGDRRRHHRNHPRWDFNRHPESHEVGRTHPLNPLWIISRGVPTPGS